MSEAVSSNGQTTRRLFFALWPGRAVRDALAGIARDLPPGQGRRVDARNLHVTLAFIGQANPDYRQCLSRAAATVEAAPFTFTLDRLGYFARTRVVWLGAGSVPPELPALVKSLNKALRRCGYKPDRRAFVPHVTLARKARPLDRSPEVEPVHWPVNGFRLMASKSNNGGVCYEPLEEFTF